MKRRAASELPTPGQDSFLDVVANLVGILIILVMVVGMQARQAMEQAASQTDAPVVARAMSPR